MKNIGSNGSNVVADLLTAIQDSMNAREYV